MSTVMEMQCTGHNSGLMRTLDVLPTNLPQSPSFYLESHHSSNLLAPYFYQSKHLLDHILDNLPEVLKGWKDTFEMAGTGEYMSHNWETVLSNGNDRADCLTRGR